MDDDGGALAREETAAIGEEGGPEQCEGVSACEKSRAAGECGDEDPSERAPEALALAEPAKADEADAGRENAEAPTGANADGVPEPVGEDARVDASADEPRAAVGNGSGDVEPSNQVENAEDNRIEKESKGSATENDKQIVLKEEIDPLKSSEPRFSWETQYDYGDESGTEEEQYSFRKEVETFYKGRNLEFKAPKFYKEELNLLKLYRAVVKLGGYEQVTSCKLWRQVGAPFRPPKTCTTVSWTFRNFYEKALLEYEKYRMQCGELPYFEYDNSIPKSENQVGGSHISQASTSGRALRDAAARAMQGWHSQSSGNAEDGKYSFSQKSDKQIKSGLLKRKKTPAPGNTVPPARTKASKPQLNSIVIDVGPPADWVKINVYKINECFEVYALVPGLLREEVHVQSDPAGRLIISGQPQQLDNPWGVTPFKKVVSLPSRIDPHQTSAVVTLNGQLFVRVPCEQKDL
ncbi:AT-rich interactive domain-containing protein 3-like isoform X2 [Rhodamnia argentea]|uniref:AT-rich interactive domain-containing protein 3-like isoform X2 n=1 Tax=Rhodamnia argentea TaxID=178133 RepID=A0ABM3GVN6_9MYRT|nr:AT-rich interactive domain-containing protein 3-like isoform X2 [Rhodamnia argentea]